MHFETFEELKDWIKTNPPNKEEDLE